jgi:hypothetical protein
VSDADVNANFSKHLTRYILKEEADKALERAVQTNSMYYAKILEEKRREAESLKEDLITTLQKEQSVWTVCARLVKKLEAQGRIKPAKLEHHEDEYTRRKKLQGVLEHLLILGCDFTVLLEVMQENDSLRSQWRNIVIFMKVLGYNEFDTDI